MDDRRRSSVYDFTALQLHPDGSRVHQTSDNLTLGKRKNTAYNPRRGWFAKDTGGSSIVPGQKTKLKRKFSDIGDSDCDGDGDEGSTSVDESVVVEQESRGRTMERKAREVKSMKAKKRQKFEEDDTFLGKLAQKERDGVDRPPSDLLKSIHYHASEFYKKRGVLETPKKHRYEKKNKRVPEAPEQRDASRSDSESSREGKNLKKYLDWPESPTPSRNNMYRAFEGSLLLGLGVLTQEKTARLLESKTPQRDGRTDGAGAYPSPYSSCIRDSDSDDIFRGREVGERHSDGEEIQEEIQEQVSTVEFSEWDGITSAHDSDESDGNTSVGPKVKLDGKKDDGKEGVSEEESEDITQFTSDEETDPDNEI